MSSGWILDTGAVRTDALRKTIVRLMPEVRAKGLRVVLPEHVLLELARQELQRRRADPSPPTPGSVVGDLRAELAAVEHRRFGDADTLKLLGWLVEPGVDSWQLVKLQKAVTDGFPPIREAFLDLTCPVCSKEIRACTCTKPVWRKDDLGVLKSRAHDQWCPKLVGKSHASATIDWLTVAMALQDDLAPVTSEKDGPEWRGLPWISVAEFENAVRKAP